MYICNAPINKLPHSPPHVGKGGDRLGIYLIVEVMPLPLGPIYWVNPHIYLYNYSNIILYYITT